MGSWIDRHRALSIGSFLLGFVSSGAIGSYRTELASLSLEQYALWQHTDIGNTQVGRGGQIYGKRGNTGTDPAARGSDRVSSSSDWAASSSDLLYALCECPNRPTDAPELESQGEAAVRFKPSCIKCEEYQRVGHAAGRARHH